MNFIKHIPKEALLFKLKRENLAEKEHRLRIKRREASKKLFYLAKKQGFSEGLKLIEAELKRTSSIPVTDQAKQLLHSVLSKMGEKIATEFPELLLEKLNSMIPRLPQNITLVVNPDLQLKASIPVRHDPELPIDTIEVEHPFGKLRYSITSEMRDLL